MKVLLTTLLLLLLLAGCTQQNFKGVPLTPAKPAPDFTLTNQFGEEVSLNDFRGKVVVMSFLYTNCPTVCPIITSKFISAAEELGDSAGRDVVFVAVTVDPERDTTDKIRRYSEEKGMLDKWHYFTGGRVEVERVWRDYNIYVNRSQLDEDGNYIIDHTAKVFVIDKKGTRRVVFPGITWDSKDLAHDVRLL